MGVGTAAAAGTVVEGSMAADIVEPAAFGILKPWKTSIGFQPDNIADIEGIAC